MEHLCKRLCALPVWWNWPRMLPRPKGGVMPSVARRMNEFVMQNKPGIGPPFGRQQSRMQVDDANFTRRQSVWTGASDPAGDAMTTDRSFPKHAKGDLSEDGEVLPLPRLHGPHAFEDLVLKDAKHLGLGHVGTQKDTSRPTMVSRMPFLDGDKQAVALCTTCAVGLERHLHPSLPAFDFRHLGRDLEVGVHRSGSQQANAVGSRDGARGFRFIVGLHQSNGSGPVSMAIQQGSNDAPVDHSGKGVVVRFWSEEGHQFIPFLVGIDSEAVRIGRAAAVANRTRSIGALHTFRRSHAEACRRGAFQVCASDH